MRFEEIPAPSFSLRVKRIDKKKLPTKDVRTIKFSPASDTLIIELFNQEDFPFTVEPTHRTDVYELSGILGQGRTTLAKLINPASDGSAELRIVLFKGTLGNMYDFDIGVDENVMAAPVFKKSRNNAPVADSLDDIVKKLKKKCVLEHCGTQYVFILAGDAAKEQNYKMSSNNEDSEESDPVVAEELDEKNRLVKKDDDSNGNLQHFAIVGSDIRFTLSKIDTGSNHEIFLATNIAPRLSNKSYQALNLAFGNIKFVDWTKAGVCKFQTKRQLDKLIQNKDSYLKKWDDFQIVEGNLFFEKVRKLGAISFTIIDETKGEDGQGDTIEVKCNNLNCDQKMVLNEMDALHCVEDDDLPEFLKDPDITFTDYFRTVIQKEARNEFDKVFDVRNNNNLGELIFIDKFNPDTGHLFLKKRGNNVEFTNKKKLIFPIKRDMTPIKRRLYARYDIQNGYSVNPNLGLLIEEGGQILATQAFPKVEALTGFVKEKVFHSNKPTEIQRTAIDIALNTPDIALIQGPPGTGKTTIIAAINERLNELSDKRKCISGNVLLSSFQHDAVENMIGRMFLNGLPVPKFGHRSGEAEGKSDFECQVQKMFETMTSELRKKNPSINESQAEKELRKLCTDYKNTSSLIVASQLLNKAISLSYNTLDESLRNQLKRELALIKNELDREGEECPQLPYIRGLRTTKNSFADDGASRAYDALYALRDEDLDEADKALLEKASLWNNNNETPPFINDLKALKYKLLQLYTPTPAYRIEKPRESVNNLIEKTLKAIQCNGFSLRDKKTAALAELTYELESNPERIIKAVESYCFAFAATGQQSVGGRIKNLKKKSEYDYVIVDEAARFSPPDLLIPMSQGKRIILVGDHRQLPQFINDDVVRRLEEETKKCIQSQNTTGAQAEFEIEWLEKSMFEYFFTERLRALEDMDHITRRVTLNIQYRMHPILGDFISENFYERFDPTEKFSSWLPESHFAHQLPGTDGKCAIWLDVPFKNGKMKRKNSSWFRPAEADVICSKLEDWIEYDNSRTDEPELKFGVISFYKAQAELIKKRLKDKFRERIDNGSLEVGTVDAFQGKEFDVVFLSLVRAVDITKIKPDQKPFAFLQVYNRLNVSMSRQKKLLVVVGDAELYETNVANEQVPGLYNFLKLCHEKGKVL